MEKIALITGASQGIGAAVAAQLAQKGFRVAINYNKSEAEAFKLCESINKQGKMAKAFKADISDELQIIEMVRQVKESLGSVDVLVNNAGIAYQALFTMVSEKDFDKIFGVCVKGAFFASKHVLPDMINKKYGRIINIASIWGETGASCEVHYSAAKAAIIGFTKALAKEEAPSGITVNCVSPGAVDTAMLNTLSIEDKKQLCDDTPLGRLATPTDIAHAVAFLASDEASFITGQVLGINGGLFI